MLIAAHATLQAQTIDPQQAAAMTQAYMNAGDTVGIYAYNTEHTHTFNLLSTKVLVSLVLKLGRKY